MKICKDLFHLRHTSSTKCNIQESAILQNYQKKCPTRSEFFWGVFFCLLENGIFSKTYPCFFLKPSFCWGERKHRKKPAKCMKQFPENAQRLKVAVFILEGNCINDVKPGKKSLRWLGLVNKGHPQSATKTRTSSLNDHAMISKKTIVPSPRPPLKQVRV